MVKSKKTPKAVADKPRDPQLLWLYEEILPEVSQDISDESAKKLALKILIQNQEKFWRTSARKLAKFIPVNDKRQHSLKKITVEETAMRAGIGRTNAGQRSSDKAGQLAESDPKEWFEKHIEPCLKGLAIPRIEDLATKIIRKFGEKAKTEDFWRQTTVTKNQNKLCQERLESLKHITLSL